MTPLLEELVITFHDAHIEDSGGRRRTAGRFRVLHVPAQGTGSRSDWYGFESPLGPIEIEEIRWYLERYPFWPYGTFRERATRIESDLPKWGRSLYDRTLGVAREQTSAWRRAPGVARRVVVEVDDLDGLERSQGAGGAGAAALLALPWELFAGEEGYLFEGDVRARVVRRIPRMSPAAPFPTADCLRVLLIIARPEQEGVSLLDPRASARSVVEALAPLGHRAELEVLADGTFPALHEALSRAEVAGLPFQVVHFDGHGLYDKEAGLGKLCFESPEDAKENSPSRRVDVIDAQRLGELLRYHRVPLFVLDACQTATADERVSASVAARLFEAGVGSVLAMTHSVLVETARRFVGRFYESLAVGERIGSAMVAGERYLRADPSRLDVGGHGELRLQDWFVPVLFQEENGDLQLLHAGALADWQDLAAQRKVREGELPPPPAHGFAGRGRELLALQRLLRDQRFLAVLGTSGQGKTTLAVECARWLLDLRRFECVAFASLEDLPGARLLLERLGRQLVPGYSIAKQEGSGTYEEGMRRARLPIERELAERRVLLLIDNLDPLLAAPGQQAGADLNEALELLFRFTQIGETRLLLTSREAPPSTFDLPSVRLGPLSQRDGRELWMRVLARLSLGATSANDADRQWIDELIEKVNGHARSLVLLAPFMADRGPLITTQSVADGMRDIAGRRDGEGRLSLQASLHLSLARLPEPLRRQARALALFHGAVHVEVLAEVLEVEPQKALTLCSQLVAVGLGDAEGRYLFPDPALGPALADELSDEERYRMEERWVRAELAQIHFLYRMRLQDANVAAGGARPALKDLLVALEKAEERVGGEGLSAEAVMSAVARLLQLVRFLGRPAILVQLENMRRRLECRLEDWSHARFESSQAEIEQYWDQGNVSEAVGAAARLRERGEAAGNTYPGSANDRALASVLFSQALLAAGRAWEALASLDAAERSFIELARAGSDAATRMVGTVASERGNALRNLGRLDEAAQWYRRAIEIAEGAWDRRTGAVERGQLGTLLFLQGKLQEALTAYEEARMTFEVLQEPASVATAWHQIAQVHEATKHWDLAEEAYQRSLHIRVALEDKSGQASSLSQLGNLYLKQGLPEESAKLHQQAASFREETGDSFAQARSLNNLADALRSAGHLVEARQTATRAAHLQAPFGHAAKPWITWSLLHSIEALAGRAEAASAARSRAIELYAAYRQDGGGPQSSTARLIARVSKAMRQDGPAQARTLIPPPDQFDHASLQVCHLLFAIIDGSVDPRSVADSFLDCEIAFELHSLAEGVVDTAQFSHAPGSEAVMAELRGGSIHRALELCSPARNHSEPRMAVDLLRVHIVQIADGWRGLETLLPETANRAAKAGVTASSYWLAFVLASAISSGTFSKADREPSNPASLLPDAVRDLASRAAGPILSKLLLPTDSRPPASNESNPDDPQTTTLLNVHPAPDDWARAILIANKDLAAGDAVTAAADLERACAVLRRQGLAIAWIAARCLHAKALLRLAATNIADYWREIANEASNLHLRALAARSLYQLAQCLPRGSRERTAVLSEAEDLADHLGLHFLEVQIKALREPSQRPHTLQREVAAFVERISATFEETASFVDSPLPQIAADVFRPTLFPDAEVAERAAGAILFRELLWPRRLDTLLREAEKTLVFLSGRVARTQSSDAATAWSQLAQAKDLILYDSGLGRAETWLQAAHFHRLAGEPRLARKSLENARRLGPPHGTAAAIFAELALLEEADENLQRALTYLNDALRYGPPGNSVRFQVRLLYQKGRLLLRMGHLVDSKRAFHRLIDQSEGSQDATVLHTRTLAEKSLADIDGGSRT